MALAVVGPDNTVCFGGALLVTACFFLRRCIRCVSSTAVYRAPLDLDDSGVPTWADFAECAAASVAPSASAPVGPASSSCSVDSAPSATDCQFCSSADDEGVHRVVDFETSIPLRRPASALSSVLTAAVILLSLASDATAFWCHLRVFLRFAHTSCGMRPSAFLIRTHFWASTC